MSWAESTKSIKIESEIERKCHQLCELYVRYMWQKKQFSNSMWHRREKDTR